MPEVRFTLEEMDPDYLRQRLHPQNWGIHPAEQLASIRESVEQHGILDAPMFNRRTQTVIDGHGYLEAIAGMPLAVVPVKVIDVDESEELRILAEWNHITQMREGDNKALLGLLRRAAEEDDTLPIGYSWADFEALSAELEGGDAVELEPEDTDASFAPNPYAEREAEAEVVNGGTAQTRIVQLYLDAGQGDAFLGRLRELAQDYGTENITDTVLHAVGEAYFYRHEKPAAEVRAG